MGQQAVNAAEVIDDSFAGLVSPQETHRMGRPDIKEGRPGDTLVAEVARFDAEGGFRKLAEERDRQRALDEAAGRPGQGEPLPDFGVSLPGGEAKDHDLSKDSSED